MDGALRMDWGDIQEVELLVLVMDWMCGWDGEEEEKNVKNNS